MLESGGEVGTVVELFCHVRKAAKWIRFLLQEGTTAVRVTSQEQSRSLDSTFGALFLGTTPGSVKSCQETEATSVFKQTKFNRKKKSVTG